MRSRYFCSHPVVAVDENVATGEYQAELLPVATEGLNVQIETVTSDPVLPVLW